MTQPRYLRSVAGAALLSCAGLGAVAWAPATQAAACANPQPATAYDEAIDSPVPADLDPRLITPPAATTRIAFSVLVPERCPGQQFPVIFNYAAWGTQRVKSIAARPNQPLHASLALANEDLIRQLPNFGYVVISADPRGIGDSVPANGGGVQRLMDPNAEIQDARAILDWAYDHAGDFAMQTETGTGIAKDLRLGTFGLSYGGGFQMSLAALDRRVDAIVPTMTWNDLAYSLTPGAANKLGWGGFLCTVGTALRQQYTPTLTALCDAIGLANPQAASLRSEPDLEAFYGVAAGQTPSSKELQRQAQLEAKTGTFAFPSGQEVIDFLEHPGMAYFEAQQQAGQPWGFGESRAQLRPVPALFVQGNSDLLFNLAEAFWNWRYFNATGADVRILSVNGGHNAVISPQTGYCGSVSEVDAIFAWFGHYLKGEALPDDAAVPKVCISVSDTVGAPYVDNVGVALNDFPVGSLSGNGALPAQLAQAQVDVGALVERPVFLKVATIGVDNAVLAGVPTIGQLTVGRGFGAPANLSVVAQVGVGIRRNGQLIGVDQQVTGFAEGSHTAADPFVARDDRVMLPAVGERLRRGDEVGLLFYPENYDFEALLGGQTLTGLPQLLEQVIGLNLGSGVLKLAGSVNGLLYVNPYTVTAQDIELPILQPGVYPGSRLLQ